MRPSHFAVKFRLFFFPSLLFCLRILIVSRSFALTALYTFRARAHKTAAMRLAHIGVCGVLWPLVIFMWPWLRRRHLSCVNGCRRFGNYLLVNVLSLDSLFFFFHAKIQRNGSRHCVAAKRSMATRLYCPFVACVFACLFYANYCHTLPSSAVAPNQVIGILLWCAIATNENDR